MAVIRVNKTKDYTVISNCHLRDKRITLKAKGLLSQMLSLPDDWDYTIDGLCTMNKENKSSIQTALKELEDAGYLIRTRLQDALGRFSYQYDIYEHPQAILPQTENPCTDNPCTEHPQTENQPLLNTNKQNTNKQNTEILITEYTDDNDVKSALLDFADMRKKIKKPMTERAWRLIFGKLDTIAPTNEVKIAVLNNAIEHCWQSVYPLKENGSNRQIKGEERLGWIDDI